jgi:cytosine/adenosine deaminase-related metal-dependent hydrolase
MKDFFLKKVREKGGFKCYHAHFDKAFLINENNIERSQSSLQEKWKLYREFKNGYSYDDLWFRMSKCIDLMIAQDVKYCRSFVDADSIVGLLPIEVACDLKEYYKNKIKLEFGIQPLEGLEDQECYDLFVKACQKADIIGGLPDRDSDPLEHIEKLFKLSKDLDKKVDIHVGQNNIPTEIEEEMVVNCVEKWGMHNKVNLIHAISLSCQSSEYISNLSKRMKKYGISVIVCPSAAISMKQNRDYNAPIHNSIAPVNILVENGVKVGIGIDNISDLFMPLVDGDLWFESRLLMESIRNYDFNFVSDIVTIDL